jgi:NADPH-dependent 2,4-dienoyl-CoA reductase/sulfur reductase-like enzyme
VLEASPALAQGMARNNRIDLLLRLKAAGVRFRTDARVERLDGERRLHFTAGGAPQVVEDVRYVVAAVGAVPDRDALPEVEAAGAPYTLVGDANLPGDFLSVLRDASMAGLAIGLPLAPPR